MKMEMEKLILMNFLKDTKKCSVYNVDLFLIKRFIDLNHFSLIIFKYIVIN